MADYSYMGRSELRDKNAAARDFIDSMRASSKNPETFNTWALDKLLRRPELMDNEILRDRLREILGAKEYASITEYIARRLNKGREAVAKMNAAPTKAVKFQGKDIDYFEEKDIDTAIRMVMQYLANHVTLVDIDKLPDHIFNRRIAGSGYEYYIRDNRLIDRNAKHTVLAYLLAACRSNKSGLMPHTVAALAAPAVAVNKRDIQGLYAALVTGVLHWEDAAEMYKMATPAGADVCRFEDWFLWQQNKTRALSARHTRVRKVLAARYTHWETLAAKASNQICLCEISAPQEFGAVAALNGNTYLVRPIIYMPKDGGAMSLGLVFAFPDDAPKVSGALKGDLKPEIARFIKVLSAVELNVERKKRRPRRSLDLGE